MTQLLSYTFFTNALISSILAGLACGLIGSFTVAGKKSSLGGSIAHASFGGIGLAYFFGFEPVIGSMIFGLLIAFLLGLLPLGIDQERQFDALIGAIWSIGMAIGLIFIQLTPGYAGDLMSYLFGNILLVSHTELWLMAFLNLLIIFIIATFYRKLIAMTFDNEYARVIGLKTRFLNLILLVLTALTIVILIRAVGIILVIALLTIPASIGLLIGNKFTSVIIIASTLAVIFNIAGLFTSYYYNLPSGPIIILIAGIAYLLTMLIKKIKK